MNPELFNGEPFCDVKLDSLCPDLLRYTDCGIDANGGYTKCTEISISAEACKTSPNHFGKYPFFHLSSIICRKYISIENKYFCLKSLGLIFYTRLGFVRQEEKACIHGAIHELDSFKILNDSTISYLNARDACEEYCLGERNCWGCTLDCENDCKWNAITECTNFKVKELGEGGTTQKPGKIIILSLLQTNRS